MAPVIGTAAALAAIARLKAERGPIMFVQSGGCCDGSLPMCFADGELVLGDGDLLLGSIAECPFYIDRRLYGAWGRPQLILDVAPGEPEGFSFAAPGEGHFITRSLATIPAKGANL